MILQHPTFNRSYILHINMDYPECHMGFEVVFSSGVQNKSDGYEYDVAHDKIPAKFQYCVIMGTGPVLGKFAREVDKIHSSKSKMNPKCELTYTARKKIITVVDNQPGREKTWSPSGMTWAKDILQTMAGTTLAPKLAGALLVIAAV
eukprot:12567741-Ditylum_brightwellii.AAC.2